MNVSESVFSTYFNSANISLIRVRLKRTTDNNEHILRNCKVKQAEYAAAQAHSAS